MLPQIMNHVALSSLLATNSAILSSSLVLSGGPSSFSLTVSPCLSVMVRLVRISFSMGTRSIGNPENFDIALKLLARRSAGHRNRLCFAAERMNDA